MERNPAIGIIGTGNVGTQLAIALHEAGYNISYLYNRTPTTAVELAKIIGAQVANSLDEMHTCNLIILAVNDNSIQELVSKLTESVPVVTTSGAFNILPLVGKHAVGVLYPLQSFTKGIPVDLKKTPFFIETSDDQLRDSLESLARSLSDTVVYLTAQQRLQLHIAAVFINNFTNHMIALGQAHLERYDLSYEWLKPLLEQTIAKLNVQDAYTAQTGPARRHDTETLTRHIEQLPNTEQIIYQLISEHIRSMYPKV